MKAPLKWFVFVSFICLSCSNRKEIPSNILVPEQMGKVLFDIALAEEFASTYIAKDPGVNKDSAISIEVDKVMKIHKISQERFRESYDFYKTRPDVLKEIVDSVYARAMRERANLYKERG